MIFLFRCVLKFQKGAFCAITLSLSLCLCLSVSLSLSYHFLFFKAPINYPTGFPRVCLSKKSEPKHSRKQNKTDQQQETAMTKGNRNKKDKKEWNNFSVPFLKEDVLLDLTRLKSLLLVPLVRRDRYQ